MEVTIRESSTEALREQHRGRETSSVTCSGLIEETQNTSEHPVSTASASAVHYIVRTQYNLAPFGIKDNPVISKVNSSG